jgi:hypothetical protein
LASVQPSFFVELTSCCCCPSTLSLGQSILPTMVLQGACLHSCAYTVSGFQPS